MATDPCFGQFKVWFMTIIEHSQMIIITANINIPNLTNISKTLSLLSYTSTKFFDLYIFLSDIVNFVNFCDLNSNKLIPTS